MAGDDLANTISGIVDEGTRGLLHERNPVRSKAQEVVEETIDGLRATIVQSIVNTREKLLESTKLCENEDQLVQRVRDWEADVDEVYTGLERLDATLREEYIPPPP